MKGSSKSSGNYSPQNVTVVIGINNTIEWVNDDSVPHTVSSLNCTFNSRNMNPGAVYNFTFTSVGSYPYFCEYHD